MYNYSSVIDRIYSTCIPLIIGCAVLALITILMTVILKKKLNWKSLIAYGIIAVYAVGLAAFYWHGIATENVSSYTGEFVRENRSTRAPSEFEYVFWNGEGKNKGFYLTINAKKEIFPNQFAEGEEYTIYFEETWNIIVKVEKSD